MGTDIEADVMVRPDQRRGYGVQTVDLQALALGVRTGAASSVLFPVDPVANASRVLSDLVPRLYRQALHEGGVVTGDGVEAGG